MQRSLHAPSLRIRGFSQGADSKLINEILIRVNRLQSDPDFGKRYIFTDSDDYTHAILINTCQPELRVKPECVLGLAWEPPEFLGLTHDFIQYAKQHIGRYLIGSTALGDQSGQLPSPFTSGYAYIPHNNLTEETRQTVKTKFMSIMISNKVFAPGHRYRHQLVQRILASELPIDIYGRGCAFYQSKDPRLKGSFTDEQAGIMQRDYMFHVCIENFRHPHYISEKLTDAIVWNAIPVYLGCTTVEEYLPNTAFHLSGNIDYDFRLLETLSKHCSTTTTNMYKEQFAKLQLAKHNFFTDITLKRDIQKWLDEAPQVPADVVQGLT